MITAGEVRTYANRNGIRAYVMRGIEPAFSKRRGRVVDLIIWEGTCRECGAPFRTATGTSKREIERGPEVVRCPDHRAL